MYTTGWKTNNWPRKSCKTFLSRELFYLRLNVILEIVDEISRGTISRDNKDFPIVALGLANSNFCRSLPHNLCEMARAAFKARVFEVVPACIERNKDTRSTLYDWFFFSIWDKLAFLFFHDMYCALKLGVLLIISASLAYSTVFTIINHHFP